MELVVVDYHRVCLEKHFATQYQEVPDVKYPE